MVSYHNILTPLYNRGLWFIISEQTPRSLCDSTITALANYIAHNIHIVSFKRPKVYNLPSKALH